MIVCLTKRENTYSHTTKEIAGLSGDHCISEALKKNMDLIKQKHFYTLDWSLPPSGKYPGFSFNNVLRKKKSVSVFVKMHSVLCVYLG